MNKPSTPSFLPARAKLCIASLDNPDLRVRAQYNPKELQLDKQMSWEEHKSRNNQSEKREDRSEQDDLEFKGAAPRSVTIELLFDGYEQSASVEPDVITLEKLSSVQGPEAPASQQAKRRPHHCIVTWGASDRGMRPFLCVIESLAVKYTMWDQSGMPMRATCTVKLKEAQKMKGTQAPDSYQEERRNPSWARASAPPRRGQDPDAYMRELAETRDRISKQGR